MTRLFEVRDLNVMLPTRHGPLAVSRDISFSLEEKQILGVAGESGCGKTMTMLALTGLLPPGSRVSWKKLELAGRSCDPSCRTDISKMRDKGISYIFQEPGTHLNPLFSIGEQLTETILCNNRGLRAKTARQEAVRILENVGLRPAGDFLRRYPHQLSGGMNQRAMIGLALAADPKLLIADEPTTALDLLTQRSIIDLVLSLVRTRGLSVIWVSHDISLMESFADTLAVMYAGRIVESGPAKDMTRHARHPYTRALIHCLPERLKEKRFQPIPGHVPALNAETRGCAFYPRCPFGMPACAQAEPLTIETENSRKIKCFFPQNT
ncbi:MAG: ABC transporter ATP-binding protein [Candidatus Omnitrophota bacterium]